MAAGAQWIRLYTDMFDKRKIKKLRRLPAGNDILLIWIMLLTLAGKCNDAGNVFITEDIAYSEDDFADEFGFDTNTIRLAFNTFCNLNMIAIDEDGFVKILGWEEHQNESRLAEMRAKDRERKRVKRGQGGGALTDKSEADRDKRGDDCGEAAQEVCGAQSAVEDVSGDVRTDKEDVSADIPRTRCTEIPRTFHGQSTDVPRTFRGRSGEIPRLEEEREKEIEEEYSFTHSLSACAHEQGRDCDDISDGGGSSDEKPPDGGGKESAKLKLLGGKLGKGAVMLSDEQFEYLADNLSLDELSKYIGIVADCELNGKRFRKKSHFQAILDMVKKDRQLGAVGKKGDEQ